MFKVIYMDGHIQRKNMLFFAKLCCLLKLLESSMSVRTACFEESSTLVNTNVSKAHHSVEAYSNVTSSLIPSGMSSMSRPLGLSDSPFAVHRRLKVRKRSVSSLFNSIMAVRRVIGLNTVQPQSFGHWD